MRTARGRVLRDTAVGDGLLSVDGAQYPFRLEGVWKSQHAPKVDMAVEVDFDDAGTIVAVRALDPAAQAREQAAKLASQAGVAAKQAGDVARQAAAEFQAKGLPVLATYAGRIGIPTLVAMACVLIGWFVFTAISIEEGGDGASTTFYGLMQAINDPEDFVGEVLFGQGSASAGIYGLLCILALLAPLIPHFLPKRGAWLAYCAPLAWMLLAYIIGRWKISSAMEELGGGFGGIGGGIAEEVSDAISIGFGIYLSAAAALYLAYVGVQRFRGRSAVPATSP